MPYSIPRNEICSAPIQQLQHPASHRFLSNLRNPRWQRNRSISSIGFNFRETINFLAAAKELKISSLLISKPSFVSRLYKKLLDSFVVFVTNFSGILALRSLYDTNRDRSVK